MARKVFIDTNLLFYAVDTAASEKHHASRAVLATVAKEAERVLSSQVLQEFAANGLRKLGLGPEDVRRLIVDLPPHELVRIDQGLVVQALGLVARYHLSYWDACIVAAALHARCRALYSEDLQDGMRIEGLRVVNPLEAA